MKLEFHQAGLMESQGAQMKEGKSPRAQGTNEGKEGPRAQMKEGTLRAQIREGRTPGPK